MAQKNKKKAGPLQKRARRDVRFAIDPILDELRRAQEGAERDYGRANDRVGDIYTALRNELAPLGGEYQQQAAGISQDLNQSLGGLTGLLAPSSAAYEGLAPEDAAGAQALAAASPETAVGAAGVGMFGSLGAGSQALLAGDRSRNLGYQTSTRRQVGLERQAVEESMFQDYQDILDEVREGRIDVMRDVPAQILTRLDQLRDSRKQNKLAQSELELRERIADRELDQADKVRRSANRSQNRQMDFAQSEIDRRQNKRVGNRLQGDIKDLKGKLGTINDRIDYYGSFGGPEAQVYADELQKLYRKKKRVKGDIRQKRKRKRSLT